MRDKLTGSTGNAVQDGTVRGMIAGAMTGILALANNKLDWLTDADVVVLAPVVVFAAFFLAGLWDKFVAPRLN